MDLPIPLTEACRRGRLLLLWGALPFPLAARPSSNRVSALRRWAEDGPAPAGALLAALPGLPPLPMLSLDPTDRVERAFQRAGSPLQVVRAQSDVPVQGRHALLKLAGDLATRQGVVLSREELHELRGDPHKRHLLHEARRRVRDGALLLLGGDPENADFAVWWSVLAPALGEAAFFALGAPGAAWPAGVVGLGQDLEALSAALWALQPSPTLAVQPDYDTAAVRRLLTEAFGDEELTILCYDHFGEVHEKFAAGMTKGQKIQLLVEFCQRHVLFGRLLALVKQVNPAQYEQHRSGLRG